MHTNEYTAVNKLLEKSSMDLSAQEGKSKWY
jgi:hypothetical protein